jgi:hypothetical protein
MIKSRAMRLAGKCSTHGRDKKYDMVLVGKPEGRRPFEKQRCG